jgi:hypothetical protein
LKNKDTYFLPRRLPKKRLNDHFDEEIGDNPDGQGQHGDHIELVGMVPFFFRFVVKYKLPALYTSQFFRLQRHDVAALAVDLF